jgi:FAD/FMN-containing dehydrogenase
MSLNAADTEFYDRLAQHLPEDVMQPVSPRYLEEPRRKFHGQCGVLALPRDTQQVSVLVEQAARARVPVVPYGGGTGLVGGQIAPSGPAPLIISLERMRAIRAVYPAENVMITEAGAILSDVQAAALDANRLFPLSLAAEGSATIGGNLATNAGGSGVLRYGNARDLCLGLEAVLSDGRIWNGLSRLRKDNTGYNLRNLLIGAEGTLGLITAASLKLYPLPVDTGTALMVVPSPEAALDLLDLARGELGEALSAFELIHGQGLEFLAEELPAVRQPFATRPPWCVLIEVGMSERGQAAARLTSLFEVGLDAELVHDGLIAQSEEQRREFWSVREHIPEGNRRVGAISSHDISIPISSIPEFLKRGEQLVRGLGLFRINAFGHLGDGNLHFNVFPPKGAAKSDYAKDQNRVKRAVHDLVHEMDGSVSAEHGVGRLKVEDLERYGDPVGLDAMRAIKAALDPHGIMNPGAVLRQG